jgi:hypothetical protein
MPFDSSICVDPLGVILSHDSFFQGLLRVRGPAALEWQYLRNGQNVERFPESLSVEIVAIPSYCAQPRQLPVWTDKLIEFMGALRFELQWVEGGKFTPGEIVLVRTSALPPEGMAWPRWRYDLQVKSVNVPIADDLSIEVYSPDGQRLVRVIGGMDRADPLD